MSVIVLDKERLFLKRIRSYELNSHELYYRNDKAEERFLFILLMNEDELWSEHKFNYLKIKTLDGKESKYYSDKKVYNVMKKMAEYFEAVRLSENDR